MESAMRRFDAPPGEWRSLVHPERCGRGEEDVLEWKFARPFAVERAGQEFRFPEGIEVGAACRWEGDTFRVRVSVRGACETECGRCLANVPLVIEGTFLYFYALRSREESEIEPEEGELVLLEKWPDGIDVGPLAWESLVAELPGVTLCSEFCRGLCPNCGTNLNEGTCSCGGGEIDPRLAVLRNAKP